MELKIIKSDVVSDLRNQRYFNELEITRLVGNDSLTSHQDRVAQIAALTKENANIIEALKLLDMYFPEQQQPTPAPQPEVVQPEAV